MDVSAEFEKFREIMVAQGERDHEAAISAFPYRVEFGGWSKEDLEANCERMACIEKWLSERLPVDRYLAFPGTSIGKYKEDCFVVFMRDSYDAVILKLSIL